MIFLYIATISDFSLEMRFLQSQPVVFCCRHLMVSSQAPVIGRRVRSRPPETCSIISGVFVAAFSGWREKGVGGTVGGWGGRGRVFVVKTESQCGEGSDDRLMAPNKLPQLQGVGQSQG